MGSDRLARRVGVAGIAVATLLAASFYAVLGATTGWPTYQHDAGRSGVDPDAPQIAAISAAWNSQLDGQLYAQPLVAGGVVYAATENNTVYALNANSGAVVWQQHLATPARLNQLPCGNIDPYGITSTPALDVSSGVLYAVALQSTPTIHHELYALNVSSGGAVLRHFPIDAPGADPLVHNQRAALSLANGMVYVPYAGRAGDCGNYVGRVVGVNATDPTGASLVSYSLPNTTMGGIWAAASVDGSGALFVATGNSNATGATPDRGESVVKLSPSLGELDFFTAPEWQNLNITDTDIGSIGPILLQNGWILQSGKNGKGYLLNSANLGRVGGQLFEGQICDAGQQATAWGAYLPPSTVFIPCSSALMAVHIQVTGTPGFTVTTVRGGYSGFPGASAPILAGGVLWNLDNGNRLLLGFDPTTGQNLFSQPLSGTPAHFAAPSSGAGHLFVPAGSILEAFTVSSGAAPTTTPTLQPTSTPTTQPTSTPTIQPASTPTTQPTSTPTLAVQATYLSRAVGSPDPVAPGATFAMTSTVISSRASTALNDVEIYDPSSTRVFQQFWDNQSFAGGQPKTFNSSWQVPTTAPTGVYTIMIGVFSPGRGTLYSWNSAAGNVLVAPVSLSAALPGAPPTTPQLSRR